MIPIQFSPTMSVLINVSRAKLIRGSSADVAFGDLHKCRRCII